jgi:hypothetical protein
MSTAVSQRYFNTVKTLLTMQATVFRFTVHFILFLRSTLCFYSVKTALAKTRLHSRENPNDIFSAVLIISVSPV